ncbi:polysaccharide lyase family 7 protein [Croceivirga thetidis]|uniref:Polysaccharide lyase family 7 protein n=1 Tax=Croceivirga thetidis TaxID=2721623 RepID=A0ABX1GP91_9FLAO|nr:polysaccharide lyase family 7 protein [Croceivirga thetidis]NKI31748.1 polysaccharide lyase family 7 protein [Croceivirga thetidis]
MLNITKDKTKVLLQFNFFKTYTLKLVLIITVTLFVCACSGNNNSTEVPEEIEDDQILDEQTTPEEADESSYTLPEIDLNNWKVTLPVSENGRPIEVEPPEILNYANNEVLKPFMYNDSINGALVFYTYPGATTPNSSYSRTELREQMNPGSNSTNWTFKEGGRMKGTLSLDSISKDGDGDYHRTMVMQIHGRLTNEQRDLIGENDNNAPPMLKIYWQDGYIRVVTKALKDTSVSDTELLYTSAWEDGASHIFPDKVNFEKFSLEIKASEGKIEVVLNETESKIFESVHIDKWGVFENYFKAGNYLQSTDEDSYASVKYYKLDVVH